MKSKYEIFLDTDIILNESVDGTLQENDLLSKCLKLFVCYTSVINASEIFSRCINKTELDNVKNFFSGINILGIPFRYSVKIGEILQLIKKKILTIITEMHWSLQCATKRNYRCLVQII
ncbi:MAG: hypothetical protein WAT71_16870 [Ignavibacteria bacterium]